MVIGGGARSLRTGDRPRQAQYAPTFGESAGESHIVIDGPGKHPHNDLQ